MKRSFGFFGGVGACAAVLALAAPEALAGPPWGGKGHRGPRTRLSISFSSGFAACGPIYRPAYHHWDRPLWRTCASPCWNSCCRPGGSWISLHSGYQWPGASIGWTYSAPLSSAGVRHERYAAAAATAPVIARRPEPARPIVASLKPAPAVNPRGPWDLLAEGRERDAMGEFARRMLRAENPALPELGYGITAAMLHQPERAEWAIAQAFRDDADVLGKLPAGLKLDAAAARALERYSAAAERPAEAGRLVRGTLHAVSGDWAAAEGVLAAMQSDPPAGLSRLVSAARAADSAEAGRRAAR